MSRINLDQLQTFLAVVRLGGVRRAAAGLNLTQPAVTARIKNLETSLSCALFERTAAGLRLTKRGEMLLGHAEHMERLADRISRDIVDPAGVDGQLRLGVSETIAQCWLPDLVTELHRLYPNLQIEFNVDISIDLRNSLLNREIDLAILLGPVSEFSVDNVILPGFDMAWYVAAQAELRKDESTFLSRPVLTYARNTRPYRELREMLFARRGPDFRLFPSSSLSACFRLVEANLGVAVLPRMLGRELVAAGRIREFDPGWVPRPLQFSASYLADKPSHIVEVAAQTALRVAKTFASDQNI